MVNKEKIKEIFKKYLSEIKIIRKEYSFLELPEEEFIKIVLKEINSSIDYVDKNDYKYFLIKKVNHSLNKLIRNNLLNNNDLSLITVNNYINYKFEKYDDEHKIIDFFNKIRYFFEKNAFIPNNEQITNLIKNNDIVRHNLNFLYNKYREYLNNGNVNSLFNNYYLDMFMETYCEMKGIKNIEKIDENDSDDSCLSTFELYLSDLPNYVPFSKEEEEALFKKIKNGDKEARKIVIENNLRLVLNVAKKYSNPYLSYMDLVEEGNIGLMNAVDRFVPEKGFKFSTYAMWWIKQSIIRSISEKGRTIRIPCYIAEKIGAYAKAYDKLFCQFEREPSDEELAKYLHLDVELIKKIKKYRQGCVSLDSYIDETEEETMVKFIVDPNAPDPVNIVLESSLGEDINQLLSDNILTQREVDILKLRFGFSEDGKCYSLSEVGEMYKLTRERVRQIQAIAMNKIRSSISMEKLSSYLDDPDFPYTKR